MSYRLWWRWNDGMSGHVWLSDDDLGRLTEEMLAQGMPWPGERLAAAATEGNEVVVTPQELEAALVSVTPDPVKETDPKLWADWLAFLEGAVHKGGILIRA
jgi:hypothetical protein